MIFNQLFTKAKNLFYSNKTSSLSATNVQDAIDELLILMATKAELEGLSGKNLTTYKSFEELNTSYTEVTSLAGLVPDNSQFIFTIRTYLRETLYANGIIPVNDNGTLYVANYGSRGYARYVSDGGKFYYASSTNANEAEFIWKNNTLQELVDKINRDFYGNNGDAEAFDLMPSGTTGTNLSRLGGCYISTQEQIVNYHAPATGYAFAFGSSKFRYGIIFIGRGTKKIWFRSDATEWIEIPNTDWINTKVNGTVLWENPEGAAEAGISGDIECDLSSYSEFEIVYAGYAGGSNSAQDIRRTGRIPVPSYFYTMYLDCQEISGSKCLYSRECTIPAEANLISFGRCEKYDVEEGTNNTADYACIPLKIIGYK